MSGSSTQQLQRIHKNGWSTSPLLPRRPHDSRGLPHQSPAVPGVGGGIKLTLVPRLTGASSTTIRLTGAIAGILLPARLD